MIPYLYKSSDWLREEVMSGSVVASGSVGWRGHVQVDEVAGVASGCQGLRGNEC